MQSESKSKLYIVATPIGNLKDMTFRAVEILKQVDCILCEDTRTTKVLLKTYEINKPTLSFHTHSGLAKIDKIIEFLKDGKDLALVTDAGTPAISDPGSLLVAKVKEAMGDDVQILSVPGPSALTAAVSIVGLKDHQFTFLGFIPHKKGRETIFKKIANNKDESFVFYESTHRLIKTLEALGKELNKEQADGGDGSGNRKIYVVKEITKIYEEVIEGSAQEILEVFKADKDKIRGEFAVIVSKI